MDTTEHEGGTGGKLRRRPLRRAPSTPYDRHPVAASGIHFPPPEAEAGGSRWFSKLVDPASRVIASSASRFLSVFGKKLDAPTGADNNTIEEVPEMTSSLEIREHGENPVDGSDRSEQELISRTDTFFELEQLLKQKRFSRAEIDGLTELLRSRTIEPSTLPSRDYKNMVKVNEDLSINQSSSQLAVIHQEEEKTNSADFEVQMDQMVSLHGNVTSGVHVNIPEECFDSPIEIARTYMGSKLRKGAFYTPGLQSQSQRDKAFLLNLRLGNKLSNAAITSGSAVRFPIFSTDFENDFMTQNLQGRSALYKLSPSPYCRSFMMTNSREFSPYMDSNVESSRSLEWTPSKSRIRHSDHGQPLKRGSSDRVAGCFGDSWRVPQKLCSNDLNLSTHAVTSSTFLLGQQDKHDFDLKGLDNLDVGIFSTSALHVPPQSVEMARKILHQLDKLKPPPQNKSSEKKVVGDASSSQSSLSASHEGSLKIKANNDSTKSLNVRGSRILEDPSSSNLARITTSASPNKDLIEGEVSLTPCISGTEVTSCLGLISSVSSASVANLSMKFMDSNSHGFSLVSMQKEATVQSAPDDKVEPTKAEHAILASLKEPWEKSFVHSPDYVPASGLMHADSETKISDKAFTESKTSFNLLAAHTTNTLSKSPLSSTMATTLVDSATPMKEDSVSLLTFGSKVSTSRLNAGSMSAVSSSTGNGEPKFQFGSVNSSHSFTGVSSALSSNAGSSLSTSTVFPLSENGGFGVSASSTSFSSSLQFAFSSTQNTARNFVAVAASSCGTQGISSGNGVTKTSHKSLFQFGALDSQTASGLCSSLQASCNSQIGFAISSVKPFTSCFSSSSSVSLTSSSNRSPAVPASFSTSSSPFLLSSSSSATLGSTGLSSPSVGFSFGIPANVSVFAPLVSSRTIMPLASIGTATSAALSTKQRVFDLTTSTLGFGSGSPSNAQMIVQDSRDGSNLHPAPTAPTVGQPTSLQPVLSQPQVFQFQTYQNNTNPHNPSPF